MDYNSARKLMVSGDIVALSHRGFKSISDIESQIVKIFTDSSFSHVGIIWCVAERVFLLEAVVPRVRIFPLSSCSDFYWLSLKKGLSETALEKALSVVGQKYSKWECIKAFFGINNPNNKIWECAEYVQWVMKENGHPFEGKATPANVVDVAVKIYGATMTFVPNTLNP